MDSQLNCIHFGPCAGCVFNTDLGGFPLVDEAKRYFHEKGIVNTPVHYFGPHEWRTRAKLAVRGSSQDPVLGLFKKNSHQVLSIPHCRVHHPAINSAVEAVRQWMRDCEISPYDEMRRQGLLRYIQCTVERSTGKIQLALVCNGQLPQEHIRILWESSSLWHSIWTNLNQRIDNVIFGADWNLEYGAPWVWESLAGVECCFHPAGFAQANLTAFEALLYQLQSWVIPYQQVIEYYAGTGIIGLVLASKGCHVSCYEVNAACETAFNEAKDKLNPEMKISWKCSATEFALEALKVVKEETVVIVDPPRKGLDKKTLNALCVPNTPKDLIYVSCGWDSCKRDLDFLSIHGWQIVESHLYIFFPGSDHIETLVRLKR